MYRFLFCTSLLFLVSIEVLTAESNERDLPNIILMLGDDHGWDETAYNGHPYLKTPVLDDMASKGMQMNRFYSASAVCSPTRGSIITGRHPTRYGTFAPGWSIRPEEISIAQLMKKAGYTTAHFGKWHLGPVKAGSPTNPGAMGFDEWLSHDNFFDLNPMLSRNGGTPEKFEGEGSEIIMKEALKFIATAKKKNQSFFVVIWFGSPHEPYEAIPKDLASYDHLPNTFGNKMVTLTSNETGLQIKRLQHDVLRERFAEITAMDRTIGQLRDYLQKENLRENTLLWYFGDNGTPPEANATVPFREDKGSIYDGGVRVPCVMEWPARIKKHRVSEVNMVSSDVLPTLAKIVNQPLPDRPLDGINILSIIDGKTKQRYTTIKFWIASSGIQKGDKPYIDSELQEGTTPMLKIMDGKYTRSFKNFHHTDIQSQDFMGPRAVLDNRYKLVIQESDAGTVVKELFDIRSDPGEKNNIISAQPKIANKLEIKLQDWQQSVLQSLKGKDYQKR